MSKREDDLEYREDFDDEIWDEEQWEFFMQEADRRAEEYLKKFEEELLSKKESLDGGEDNFHPSDEREDRSPDEEQWKESAHGWSDGEGGDSFRNLAAWETAYDFESAVKRFVDRCEPLKRLSDDIQSLFENSLSISAKIASGHSMGYDREVLEGNIAYCKRALKAAENCVDVLERIRIRHTPTEELLKLYGLALQTRGEVRRWIEQLRRKVWWR